MGLLVYRLAIYTVPGLRTLITMTFWAGSVQSFLVLITCNLPPPTSQCQCAVYCVLLSLSGVSNVVNHETENNRASEKYFLLRSIIYLR